MGRRRESSLGFGENRVGKVSSDIIFVDAVFTLDTSAYASGDLLANPVLLAQAGLDGLRNVELVSMQLYDEDDQGVALTAVFSTASTSFGTLNSAPNIADADARNIVGAVAFATTDYVDVGGAKIGFKNSIGLVMRTAANAGLYCALINGAGTPTFTAAGVRAKFGFRRH